MKVNTEWSYEVIYSCLQCIQLTTFKKRFNSMYVIYTIGLKHQWVFVVAVVCFLQHGEVGNIY